MPNLLALSLEGTLCPLFDLRCLAPGRRPPDGLGIAYYPGGEPSATLLKEHSPAGSLISSGRMKPWEHLESSLFVAHIRRATWGALTDANTQPFLRTWSRRDWVFGHSGSLQHALDIPRGALFEPVGSTDSERIFCDLMGRLAEKGWHSLGDADPSTLRDWLRGFNNLGTLNCVLSDGRDLLVYADANGEGFRLGELRPPYDEPIAFGDDELGINLSRPGNRAHKGIIACSDPLYGTLPLQWRPLPPGHLCLIRGGSLMAEVCPGSSSTTNIPGPAVARKHILLRPQRAEKRRYEVQHQTIYRYASPVERSAHLFRLIPIHDRKQTLLSNDIRVSVDGKTTSYEDVFGNRARKMMVETPYTELTVDAHSRVELLDTDPLSFRPLRGSTTIPLVWMPWQRQVLQPFLLPEELPETQLQDLIEYGMSFVERNESDLLDTLLDINTTIFREYAYQQGTTTVHTTPYEVFVNRRGVCQDFANLFICLARLLGVPARYVCGYLYAGADHHNQRQAEASHAWVQVYLPDVGWRGFDPTNGVLTQTEHIRVATGRNYIDATPTSGTIFVGGGQETLEVQVRVTPF